MLQDPVRYRDAFLDNLYFVASSPMEPVFVWGGDGSAENVWGDIAGIYRARRPATLADPDLRNTKVWVDQLASDRWEVSVFHSIPLYLEDLRPKAEACASRQEAVERAEEFLRGRFRVLHPEALPRLAGLLDRHDEFTSEEAHSIVLDLIVILLGDPYKSPCATVIGTWEGTLHKFVSEVRSQQPDAVETFFALRAGWNLGKRELNKAVKRLSGDP